MLSSNYLIRFQQLMIHLSYQTHNETLLPWTLYFEVDIDNWPGSIHDFLRLQLGLSKNPLFIAIYNLIQKLLLFITRKQ